MKKIFGFAMMLAVALASCTSKSATDSNEEEEKVEMRIVSLAGTITEVIYKLGEQDQLVAVDVTSTFPIEAESLEKLGHTSQLSAESIIAQNPTHVIAFEDELKPELVDLLKNSNIEVSLLSREYSVVGTENIIKEISTIFGKEDKANEIIKEMKSNLNSLVKFENKPSILFIYARGAKMMMVAGKETPLHEIIKLAGGKNAVAEVEGYKPLTPEAVINANPDLVLMFESGIESLEGDGGVLSIPGISKTNAGINKNFLYLDGQYLSGFGPRLGSAVADINKKLAEVSKK